MPLDLVTIPCLSDNYAYLVKADGPDEVALIDAPEAAPIIAALEARGWQLGAILITHHHGDHIGGVEELRARYGCQVVGAAADAHRLPPLDRALRDGDTGDPDWVVIEVPGHTVGHIAYHFAQAGLLFSADSLMSWGCGRLFEGTPEQMWGSLSRMAALPPETLVCSGHEYTMSNGRFALSIEPGNAASQARMAEVTAARAAGRATVPVTLATELATNPFLRARYPSVRAAVGMPDAPDAEVFAEIRRRKDHF